MANTYVKIGSTVEVGSGGQAAIEFTAIPATYTDLKVVLSLRSSNAAANGLYLSLNSSTANFTRRTLQGNGATAASGAGASNFAGYIDTSGDTTSTFANVEFYIPNYTSTVAKSISFDGVTENNATTAYAAISALLWNPASNVAITAISVITDSPYLFSQYSTATLYGIKSS